MKEPLPYVEGVGPSRQRLPPGDWPSVYDFLVARFPSVGAAVWLERMARGLVVDETGARLGPESPYRAGAHVYYYREPAAERSIPFEERVIYADEHLLAVDKPHFLPVAPAGRYLRETLLVRLRRRGMPDSLTPIHRIDRETAGVVLFSTNPATRGLYTSLFRERRIEKIYEALTHPNARINFPLTRRTRLVAGEPFFIMKEVEGEPNTETHFELLNESDGAVHLRARPATGRKHQIRLHLSALGMPVVNDRFYPTVSPEEEDDFSKPLKLLAKSVTFTDPLTGQERHFESDRKL
ncbi:MAG TPA: pseudouridine synthase [Pyrinomonadaceae bacterium]|jgi:tRNA pseudouridine32 synthase/23S rRNA pseudouridine746 synthase|nr:pseudouridine synthase [Pyrinomonadaceae bacterium]